MLIKKWSGNTTSDISLKNEVFDNLYEFYQNHNQNYIFGKGKIGTSLTHYLQQSDMPTEYLTSDTINDFKTKYQQGKTGVIIGVGDSILQEILPLLETFVFEDDIFILSSDIRENIGEHFNLKTIEDNFWLNIFVTNQCNLNCKSCSSFAPICSESVYFYDVEKFRKDLTLFKNKCFNTLSILKFTGGEPFLHQNLLDLLSCGRELYPNTIIECYTNGLKLVNADLKTLKQLKELNIQLVITEYPLSNLNLKKFLNTANSIGLQYNIIEAGEDKYFSKRPLDFNKKTEKYQFINCPRYKMCNSLFLYNGSLYKCIYTFASEYVNKAFKKNLQISFSDYLNVSESNKQKVIEFCRTRIPFCGYCKPITELIPWGISERKIEEWS
jgi:organic radical activating enzyme